MLLKDLNAGRAAVITRLLSRGLHNRRLCEMGFLPGTALKIKHRAPLGYPIAIDLRGYEIIVGPEDARSIEVEAA